jgi:hypothetical protein
MANIQFKMYVDNKPAPRELLDRVEEIIVEQEVDMAWEARIEIPFCLDEKGRWIGENEKFNKPFSRVRVEIKVGENPFEPLIDGPVVGSDSQLSFEPGQSSITLQVQDDSVYLNRKEEINCFQKRSAHQLAKDIFTKFEEWVPGPHAIENTLELANILCAEDIQRGTAMQFLRALAKCHVDKNNDKRMYAYVLPGHIRGESIGVFKSFPTKPDGLPEFILLGTNRNIKSFNVKNDAQTPSNVSASTLSITDKGIISATASFKDRKLLGDIAPLENKAAATQILGPYRCRPEDPKNDVEKEADKSSYSFEATGSVLEGCYAGVLRPYRLVTVRAGKTALSGDYEIRSVTHALTRSNYSQSFSLKRNALSSTSGVETGAEPNRLSRSIF